MKKIKVYIVTYKRQETLNCSLDILFNKTDFKNYENTEVNIINNHSDFHLSEEFRNKVNVLHNVLRPDCDVGNLSRNWNQALINGFVDLNNPDSEIVVTMQNDITLSPDWCSNLMEMHKKYSLVVGCMGDNIISYKPEAVKRIGLWDERFCSICHKEADYYLRALILNKNKTIINDIAHGRVLNNHDYLPLDLQVYKGNEPSWSEIKNSHDSNEAMRHSSQIFYYKWKNTWREEPKYRGWLTSWSQDFIQNPPELPKVKNFISYHYFEKDIETLSEQNYVGFKDGDFWMRSTGNLNFNIKG